MDEDQELDNTVNSILHQLKDTTTLAKKVEKVPDQVNKEALEKYFREFITRLKKYNDASRLIENATESVEYIKDSVQAAPTSNDVISLAELIKSTSSALEVLNRIVVNNKKTEAAINIKRMDVESKREELDVKVNAGLIASREEIMNNLFKKAKVIEATIIEP